MSTPPPLPRHLPPSLEGAPHGLFARRQAARMRAIVAADLLPRERASADALVMTAWLTSDQRARYAPSLRSGPGVEEFAQRLADERRVVLEEGTDPVADELASAAEAEKQAGQLPLRMLEAVLLLVAIAGAALLAVRSARSDLWKADLPEQALPLLVGMVVAGLLAALVGTLATRRRDRSLLDWAVSRPGQLGRGLPLRRPLQGQSAGPAVVRSLTPVVLVGAGVLGIVSGAALLLITLLMPGESTVVDWSPWLLGGGAVALVLAVLLIYLRSRQQLQVMRRSRAQEWIGPEGRAEEPPAV